MRSIGHVSFTNESERRSHSLGYLFASQQCITDNLIFIFILYHHDMDGTGEVSQFTGVMRTIHYRSVFHNLRNMRRNWLVSCALVSCLKWSTAMTLKWNIYTYHIISLRLPIAQIYIYLTPSHIGFDRYKLLSTLVYILYNHDMYCNLCVYLYLSWLCKS